MNRADSAGHALSHDRAKEALVAIWTWDYCTWEAVEPHVTGPIADLLRRNMSDEEVTPDRELVDLSITEVALLDGETAEVAVLYRFLERTGQQANGQPDGQPEGLTERLERIVWIFVREDAVWKAAGLHR